MPAFRDHGRWGSRALKTTGTYVGNVSIRPCHSTCTDLSQVPIMKDYVLISGLTGPSSTQLYCGTRPVHMTPYTPPAQPLATWKPRQSKTHTIVHLRLLSPLGAGPFDPTRLHSHPRGRGPCPLFFVFFFLILLLLPWPRAPPALRTLKSRARPRERGHHHRVVRPGSEPGLLSSQPRIRPTGQKGRGKAPLLFLSHQQSALRGTLPHRHPLRPPASIYSYIPIRTSQTSNTHITVPQR